MSQKNILIILFVLLLAGGSFYFVHSSSRTGSPAPIQAGLSQTDMFVAHSDSVLRTCANVQYRPACYDEEIPKLMDVISMEDALQVTRLVQDNDPTYRYCHVLGHNLSARETAKDPSKWKDVITRCPSGMCSNGCIHGAFQERFRTDALSSEEIERVKADFVDVCEARGSWVPTGLEQGSCYHALGHLLMYVTSADIEKATALCEEVAKKPDGRDFRAVCFDGAFMQIYQPLEPEDFALVEGKQPTKKEHETFCTKFEPMRRSSCWSEGWPLHREDVMTSKGLTVFCTEARLFGGEERCYQGLFFVLTAQFNFDSERIEGLCKGLSSSDRRGQCFALAAARLIETDYRNIADAVDLCRVADATGVGAQCYDLLIFHAHFTFHEGSSELRELCASLPEPWNERCFKSR